MPRKIPWTNTVVDFSHLDGIVFVKLKGSSAIDLPCSDYTPDMGEKYL